MSSTLDDVFHVQWISVAVVSQQVVPWEKGLEYLLVELKIQTTDASGFMVILPSRELRLFITNVYEQFDCVHVKHNIKNDLLL